MRDSSTLDYDISNWVTSNSGELQPPVQTMNQNTVNTEPQKRELSSTLLGLCALLCCPILLALSAAATFWACGVAGRAFHWMCGGF